MYKMRLVIITFLLVFNIQSAFAQKYTAEDLMFRDESQEGLEEDFIVLLSMTACAFITTYLSPSCKFMPTSFYYAASAGNMYLSGEALSLVSRYKTMDRADALSKLKGGVESKNQLTLALQLKKSLLQMKISAQEKIKLQRSAMMSYKMASTFALNRFRKQKVYLDKCLSATKTSAKRTKSIPTCGGCGGAVSDARQMLIAREKNDHIAKASLEKYNYSKKVKVEIRDHVKESCMNPLCLPGLKNSGPPCETYRRVYFYNLVYCDPRKLATLGANISFDDAVKIALKKAINHILSPALAIKSWHVGLGLNENKHALEEITRLRGEASKFTDDWIAHARGRALVFGAMEDLAQKSVEVTEAIIDQLDADLAKLEPLLRKLDAKGTGKDGIVEELFGSGGFALTKDGSPPPCVFKNCNKASDYFKYHAGTIGEMGQEFGSMSRSVGKISDGLMKPVVSKATLDEAEKLGKKAANLESIRKQIERKLDKTLARRKLKPVKFDAHKNKFTKDVMDGTKKVVKKSKKGAKGLFASIFGGIISKFTGGKKRKDKKKKAFFDFSDEKVVDAKGRAGAGGEDFKVAGATTGAEGEGQVEGEQVEYEYDDINKDKYKSIWRMIHERYRKVAPHRLLIFDE